MNYGEIKAAILGRSHRNDLASHVAEFIALAESEYNRRTGSTYEIAGADTKHNWLSDNAPDVYIYGGLMQLSIWDVNDAGIQKYTALFERATAQAQYAEVRESGILDETVELDDALITSSSNILEGTP